MSLVLQADSLQTEPQGKPKNPGVGSLSLLQWIFLTQDLNQSLLHCRWILYQLSYQGSLWFLRQDENSHCSFSLLSLGPLELEKASCYLGKTFRNTPLPRKIHMILTSASCGEPELSPPCFSVHGILQARMLEWVAISFSRGPSWPRIEPSFLHWRQILYGLSHKGSP